LVGVNAEGGKTIFKILCFKPFVIIGKISYTLYLTNMFFRLVIEDIANHPISEFNIPVRLELLMLLILINILIYYCFENPLRHHLIKKWIHQPAS
jgi:peptidoglycan/LPS O-acetylase OafA/YrhL